MNQKELLITRSLLRGIVQSSHEMEAIPGSNPQLVTMRAKAKAERDLAEAVLAALGGDLVPLRLYSVGK